MGDTVLQGKNWRLLISSHPSNNTSARLLFCRQAWRPKQSSSRLSPTTLRGKKPVNFPKREKEKRKQSQKAKLKLHLLCLKAKRRREVLHRGTAGPWGRKPVCFELEIIKRREVSMSFSSSLIVPDVEMAMEHFEM